jgi:hypothetical protein
VWRTWGGSSTRSRRRSTPTDGKGGLDITRRAHDGKVLSPPISAHYTYDAAGKAWVRDPSTPVPAAYEAALPARIPTDAAQRKGPYFETT